MKYRVFTLVLIILVAVACVKIQPVSPIPEIHFKSLEAGIYYDSLLDQNLPGAKLVFSFVDGDADFGVYQQTLNVTSNPDSIYNIFLQPYYKIDSTYYLIEIDPNDTVHPPPYYRVFEDPKLDRVGQNKTIKGDITIQLIDLPQYDTIRYEFYIMDRAGHKSNVETTSDIGVNGQLK